MKAMMAEKWTAGRAVRGVLLLSGGVPERDEARGKAADAGDGRGRRGICGRRRSELFGESGSVYAGDTGI